ncbi:hypothetical protein [Tsukamurella soli]|uniref:Uncharacterized protein n=1 Tax=Tsukamurella soli TaxID=644556 RepID=A0ABP8JCN4_9ACTN
MRPLDLALSAPWHSTVTFGEPHVTPDGTTVITVSRARADSGHGEDTTSALGLYTIHDGAVTWTPAMDVERIALIGAATGFVAALLGTLAVVRRPPWPALTGTITVVRGR